MTPDQVPQKLVDMFISRVPVFTDRTYVRRVLAEILTVHRADTINTYINADQQRWQDISYTCPVCRFVSHNPQDVEQGYCGRCHDWTEIPVR